MSFQENSCLQVVLYYHQMRNERIKTKQKISSIEIFFTIFHGFYDQNQQYAPLEQLEMATVVKP